MKPKKVYISADMEGITGVIDWDETSGNNPDYHYFKKIMTEEVNAAVAGAVEAGAKEIVVRDAHGSARNIIPDLLNENVQLLRAWASGPYSMMEGIDNSFDAVLCIGYHAKSNTAAGTLAHTMKGDIFDLHVHNVSLPELGWNALIAGYVDVPVIFVSGDNFICDQARQLIPAIETVAVKQGLGEANLNLHPQKSQKLIREAVKKALDRIENVKPLKMNPPFTIEVDFRKVRLANKGAWYPGALRKGEYTVFLTCEDFLDCMRFFYFMQ